ncbi:MAG: hypothetical protein C6I01_01840 [Epsilonproteobacteria bacterium]|nr:hypothetical protein [Campylobacterota bacterium]
MFYGYLEEIKSKLEELGIFKSVEIGLEKGAGKSVNTPLARIVVSSVDYRGSLADLHLIIVVGLDLKNDIPELYRQFLDVTKNIRKKLYEIPALVQVEGLVTDEDRLENIKAGAIKVTLKGLPYEG